MSFHLVIILLLGVNSTLYKNLISLLFLALPACRITRDNSTVVRWEQHQNLSKEFPKSFKSIFHIFQKYFPNLSKVLRLSWGPLQRTWTSCQTEPRDSWWLSLPLWEDDWGLHLYVYKSPLANSDKKDQIFFCIISGDCAKEAGILLHLWKPFQQVRLEIRIIQVKLTT